MINNKIILNPIMHNGDILTIALSADENVKIKALKYNKFMMNCPYHNDRHPSFILDRNKNTFKCLSTNCSKKGNLVDLMSQIHQIKYEDCLVILYRVLNFKYPYYYNIEKYKKIIIKLKDIYASEQYKNLIDESNQKTLLYKLNSVNKYHN